MSKYMHYIIKQITTKNCELYLIYIELLYLRLAEVWRQNENLFLLDKESNIYNIYKWHFYY